MKIRKLFLLTVSILLILEAGGCEKSKFNPESEINEEGQDASSAAIIDNDTSDELLAKIYVETKDPSAEITHDDYSNIFVTISDTTQNYELSSVDAEIRGRGNATWNNSVIDKKPYRIKFNRDQNLFGMGSAKSWVLLANVNDYTLMRNYLAYTLGGLFDMEYTTPCKNVILYLNDEYKGVYLLCEQVQTGTNRVDIETNVTNPQTDLDIGYLIEYGGGIEEDKLLFQLDTVDAVAEQNNWFNEFWVAVKSLDKEDLSVEQITYIQEYLNRVNKAMLTKDWTVIQNLVDIDSCVDYFIVNQVMMSGDMGWNFFLYKPQGDKLHLGPIWDFDQSSGSSTYGGSGHSGWAAGSGSEQLWLTALIEIPEFKALVVTRWKEKYNDIHSITDILYAETTKYHEDFLENFIVWDIIGTETFRTPTDILKLKTYDENVDYLAKWITKRIEWIERELNK